MNNTPLISVIVPIYNAQEYLESTLNSVISQTYPHWEMLLIDDGSTDQSSLLINKFSSADDRIKNVRLEKSSGGPARPRNLGIELAKGDYIAFLDSDDLWKSNKLHTQINFIIDKKFDIVSTDAIFINPLGIKTGKTSNNLKKVQLYRYFMSWKFLFLIFNPISLSSSLIKNNFVIRFREDLHFSSIEDWVFWVENILSGASFNIMEEKLLFYRVHESSLSGLYGNRQMLKAFHLYYELFIEKKISLVKFVFLICTRSLRVILNRIKIYGITIFKNIFYMKFN
jgi:teichuronic acid biosynthesis glycosyltransferase TuaG